MTFPFVYPLVPFVDSQLKAEIELVVPGKTVSHFETTDTQLTVQMIDDLDATEETAVGGVVAGHNPVGSTDPPEMRMAARQADDTPVVAIASRIASSFNFATHNFCDRCTWYGESLRKTNVSLVKVGNRWVLPDEGIIDMAHGRVSDEEGWQAEQAELNPGDPHRYAFTIRVDGVVQVEDSAFSCVEDAAFHVDYRHGIVYPTVSTAWDGSTVTADYSVSQTSGWIIKPLAGKVLEIQRSEVQFSNPFEMRDSIVFESYGVADYFAPQLGLPPGTVIQLERTVWKTLDQVNDEAIGAQPEIPQMGGVVRGISRPRHILQFTYPGARRVFSSLGMYVRIWLENDQEFKGERATATFYGVSLKDPGVTEAIKEFV